MPDPLTTIREALRDAESVLVHIAAGHDPGLLRSSARAVLDNVRAAQPACDRLEADHVILTREDVEALAEQTGILLTDSAAVLSAGSGGSGE